MARPKKTAVPKQPPAESPSPAQTAAAPKRVREEYSAPNEEYWATEDWEGLSVTFGLLRSQLTAWHAALAGQGLPWEIVRRRFSVAPLLGEDLTADDFRTWNMEELATKLGHPLQRIEEELAGAVAHWRQASSVDKVSEATRGMSESELSQILTYSPASQLTADVINRLLEAHDFATVRGEKLRAEVAARIISLKDHLVAPNRRMQARQVIRMEIQMHGYEAIMLSHDARLQAILAEHPTDSISAKNIDELNEKISALSKELQLMTKNHALLLEDLGADEIDLTAQKRIFVKTITHVVDLCRDYESNPDNRIYDGIWTAREIEWLTETSGERMPQYRFDIALRAEKERIMDPENFWDPNFSPGKVPRLACERIAKIVRHLGEVNVEAAPADAATSAVDEDDELPVSSDGSDDDEEGETIADSQAAPSLPQVDLAKTPWTPPVSAADSVDLAIF